MPAAARTSSMTACWARPRSRSTTRACSGCCFAERRSDMQPIVDRAPTLARIHDEAVRTIPLVRQLEWTDGAGAALAMVLGHHGKHVALNRVRSAFGASRANVTTRGILDAAAQFGLRGRRATAPPAPPPH